ncbi:MAG: hypothetical protein V2B19_30440 [Pseudomonadota bacterium]
MDPIYLQLKKRTLQIISQYPKPDFHKDFLWAADRSSEMLATHIVVSELHDFVAARIDNDFGHGLDHAVRVTLDAGALILVEGTAAGLPPKLLTRQLLLVQCAGLLHDIRRKEKNHAASGADYAEKVLKTYTLSDREITDISRAIRNHEAFKATSDAKTKTGRMVSDCLYDADKFRWGPDNFAQTLWDMVSFHNTPIPLFVSNYPKGMALISKIRSTFRSITGQKYGPGFIDQGLAIGEELYRVMKTEFGLY